MVVELGDGGHPEAERGAVGGRLEREQGVEALRVPRRIDPDLTQRKRVRSFSIQSNL